MADNEIRQGFICPMCLSDLGDVQQLQTHFAQFHKHNDIDDGYFSTQIKGLFGKAKQRFQLFDGVPQFAVPVNDAGSPTTTGSSGKQSSPAAAAAHSVQSFEPQEPGTTTSHTKYFRSLRDIQIDQFAVETNKLIIRLDRLVTECPKDPAKRKEFEKELVEWQVDGDASACTGCGESFGVMRRKHHCRLCGAVMCKQCSVFLTFQIARKLVHPIGFVPEEHSSTEYPTSSGFSPETSKGSQFMRSQAERLMQRASSALKLDQSEHSVSSFFNQEGASHLRVCASCNTALLRRDQAIESRQSPPIVVQMYDRLTQLIDQVTGLYPNYCRAAESLNRGESMYTLDDAKTMKLQLLRLQEQIDSVSKKILTYSAGGSGAATDPAAIPLVSNRHQLLQQNIRNYAMAFLRDIILFIPNLPAEDEYARLKAEYKQRLRQQIDAERLSAQQHGQQQQQQTSPNSATNLQTLDQQQQQQQRNSNVLQRNMSAPKSVDGWMAAAVPLQQTLSLNPFADDDGDSDADASGQDPLIQQIVNIKSFLRQAAAAGRTEEVELLETHLKELQVELKTRRLAIAD